MFKQNTFLLLIIPVFIFGFFSLKHDVNNASGDYDGNTYVYQVLSDLGVAKPIYFPENITEENIKRGKEMILWGHTYELDGKKSKYISLYYVCTNCHNNVIEQPGLTSFNPQERLDYATRNKLHFLQGTTFYGAVNRESWYNGDYYKKYGDLVKPAKTDIREAVQLCAKECSKGRHLDQWEVDAILSYFYSISYKLKDILTTDEITELNKKKQNSNNNSELIAWIKSKYALMSPATFVEPPYNEAAKLPTGNAANGKNIYELSCQSCHKENGCSTEVFDNSILTFKDFAKGFDKNYWWLFEVLRHGVNEHPEYKPYMPQFTAERMSDEQVMNLKAYFLEQAKR